LDLVVQLDENDDSGAIAILVAVLSIVLFGFAAIVVDLGYARTVKNDAQSSADAASLAAASILAADSSPSALTTAIKAIKDSAFANFGTNTADWAACTATPPTAKWKPGGSGTTCILFNKNASNPTKLQVVLPAKHVDSFFGGLIGYGGMEVNALAQATIREEDVPGCALCVRGTLDTAGTVGVGPATPDGPGGSSSAGSGHVRSGGSITVEPDGAITFASPADPNPPSGPMYTPDPLYPRPVTDPFAGPGHPMPRGGPGSPQPFPSSAPTRNVTCGPGGVSSLSEAVYRNITVTGPCSATGVIVVTGSFRGLLVQAGGSLSGSSAILQFSCGTRTAPSTCGSSPTAGGLLQIAAGGSISMSTLLPDEFSIVYDPYNASPMIINDDLSVDKAIYARSSAVPVQSASV
jgi:hypothetical protein